MVEKTEVYRQGCRESIFEQFISLRFSCLETKLSGILVTVVFW